MNQRCATFVSKLKQDFNINVNLSDVLFTKTAIELYNNNENRHSSFGEKLCLLYLADFTVYNIQFSMKILTFNYDKSNEVLKLDVNIQDKWIEKEMASCRNFLQRNRNLNLTFSTLTEFAKYVESRRLICEILFSKDECVNLSRDDQGGIKIKCLDYLANMYFGACWRIEWNLKDFFIFDAIEFYYTNLDNGDSTKQIMESITQPSLDFHTKLKLWKSLMESIQRYIKEKTLAFRPLSNGKAHNSDILVISDTEDEEVSSTSGHQHKRRKTDPISCSSNIIYTIPD